MFLKNNFYITHSQDGFILTNIDTQESYLLDKATMLKLANGEYNDEFIEAGLVSNTPENAPWPFPIITRLFVKSVEVKKRHMIDRDNFDFWQEYLTGCDAINLAPEAETETLKYTKIIALPEYQKPKGSFYDLLKKRRTIREFKKESITLQQLSDILFTAFGKFHDTFEDEYLDFEHNISWRRSSPSAGGLHSVSAYVFIKNVQSIEPGAYFYHPKQHTLGLIKLGDYEEALQDITLAQPFSANSACAILTVADLQVMAKKYMPARSVILPYLDNGHLLQTAWLTAVDHGLQGWMTAAICEEYLREDLSLKETDIPMTLFCIGHGYDESLGPTIREKLKAIGQNRLALSASILARIKEKVMLK